jgi:ribonuclease P protein component
MTESFEKRERILRRADFVATYEKGLKRFHRFVIVFSRPNELGHPRIGITVTRKFGKAHDRNRVRRWTREIFRRSRPEIGGHDRPVDVVINIKSNAREATFDEYREDLLRALRRAIAG